eukprot:scaffold6008_cov118-Isochrysis_galbana.AAC.4
MTAHMLSHAHAGDAPCSVDAGRHLLLLGPLGAGRAGGAAGGTGAASAGAPTPRQAHGSTGTPAPTQAPQRVAAQPRHYGATEPINSG